MSELLDFIVRTAQDAGTLAMQYYDTLKPEQVHVKSMPNDLVSDADRAVERQIIAAIRAKYPDHGIYGEETGKTASASGWCWVIDPIDGTQSFVIRHPFFCTSIGVTYNGVPVAGAVYAPALNLLFTGEKGHGSFRNGQRIHVSHFTKLSESVCATGFACLRAGLKKNNVPYFARIAPMVREIRKCGSAALDTCFTACGTYDIYWEFLLFPYDIAAGIVIAKEAGADICDLHGGDHYPENGFVVCTPGIRQPFFDAVRDLK